MGVTAAAFAAQGCNRATPTSGYGYSALTTTAATPDELEESARLDNPAEIARKKGLMFGTCWSRRPLTEDLRYRQISTLFCNTVVVGSAFQWHEMQQFPGRPYDFGNADFLLAEARRAQLPIRGHSLLDWFGVPNPIAAEIDLAPPVEVERLLRRHVSLLATRFRGRFTDWNVVNEPISGSMRKMNWYQKLGEDYIDIAFATAGEADPGTPLTINQNLVESSSRFQTQSRDALLGLVQRLKGRGVPLHSVGIQGHILAREGVDQKGLTEFFDALRAMDVPFFISELDIDDRGLDTDLRQRDVQVAGLTRDLLDVSVARDDCLGVMCWGYTDRYSWLVKDPERARDDGTPQRPCPFDADYHAKPMWSAIGDAIRKAPGPKRKSLLPPGAAVNG